MIGVVIPHMKILRSLLAALSLGFFATAIALAQEAPPPEPPPVIKEMQVIVGQVREKMKAGKPTAESLAGEIAAFDALLAKYPEKNNDTAQVAMMKASLYFQVLNDEETGKKLLTALVADYPGTRAATQATRTLDSLTPEAKAKAKAEREAREAKLAALIGKPAPELNFTWTSRPGFKKLSDLKGNVVVLDFWATWCGPCIATFPQVREKVEHFKGSPVVILGVTSLQGFVANMGPRIDTKDNPQKEYDLMPQFMKEKNMTWDVAFSTENVFNPDYGIQGIPYVAIIAPDGTVRHTGLHPGNKAADISGKITAILKEFNLPVPAAKG
jgi:thiol-disulfide isomerase/thioredoxin